MADEPTTSELMRRLEDVRTDLKEDISGLAARLDGKVDAQMLALQQQAQDERAAQQAARIATLEEAARREARRRDDERQAAAAQRASDRRLVFTALVAPVLIVLLTVWLQTKGAGS
ncbi:hypothetical protein [Streptomyces sp. NRRL F-5123]|uniref:hypothetical protein n=1 Tax=Streptomyces sp. NRRL F-5123 TaxID=1463856 RepID=UPI0004E23F5A|nr:hypothetical protein [Streptomyces sp. NRRL F-5123]